MPTYRYRAREPEQGCERCRDEVEVVHRMSDPPLSACPDCGASLRRLIGRAESVADPRWNRTKAMLSDGNLKRLGFKKLVKESDGKYVDVLQQ